ncbi:UNVERIFIED_CONTAM: hypothetical protein NCL1_15707 [Trichonephila clavipes]
MSLKAIKDKYFTLIRIRLSYFCKESKPRLEILKTFLDISVPSGIHMSQQSVSSINNLNSSLPVINFMKTCCTPEDYPLLNNE